VNASTLFTLSAQYAIPGESMNYDPAYPEGYELGAHPYSVAGSRLPPGVDPSIPLHVSVKGERKWYWNVLHVLPGLVLSSVALLVFGVWWTSRENDKDSTGGMYESELGEVPRERWIVKRGCVYEDV
jgi:hypothetical protein